MPRADTALELKVDTALENVDRTNGTWDAFMTGSPSERERIPYEYRPVVGFVDVSVLKRRAGHPNSYYLEGSKIVLIHDDEIAEYEFTDPSALQEQVVLLDQSGIRRIDFARGWARLAVLIGAFMLVLQLIVWATS